MALMDAHATKKDVQEIVDKAIKKDVQEIVDKAVTDLSKIIASFAQQVDARFNVVEAKIAEHDQKFDRLFNTLDAFMGRIDHLEHI